MVLAFLALSLAPAPQGLAAEKLNAPLDYRIVEGDASAFDASGDGTWIAYSAQQEEATPGLYVVKSDGSFGPVRVSPLGSAFDGFAINRTGTRVVFRTNARRTLLSADPTGTLTQLNPPLVSGGTIREFRLAPGGAFAVYHADQELDDRNDLYSVALVGPPTAHKLAESVYVFTFSADGSRVLFTTPQTGSRARLFAVPVNGGGFPAPLSEGLPADSLVVSFSPSPATSPSGHRAVFLVDSATKRELYSAPIDGSTVAVKLSGPIVAGGDVEEFVISPDGTRVVYRADALVNNLQELFSVPIDGSAPPVLLSGGHDPVGAFAVAPSGLVVAFEAEVRGRMWSAPIDGLLAPLQLTSQGGGGGPTLGVRDLTVTPDSTRAVYVVSSSGFFADELRSVPLDASAPAVLLTHPLTLNDPLERHVVQPDGTLVYLAGSWPIQETLYRTKQDGSTTPVALHAAPAGWDGTGDDFVVTGTDVLFRSDLDAPQVTELYSVPLDASAAPRRLNGELHWTRGFEDVLQIGVAADGRHAAYATAGGIHTVALATPGVAVTVAAAGSDPFLGIDFTNHPERFYYHAIAPDGRHLFTAPFDGSEPPRQISTGGWAYPFGVASHRLTRDTRWLVYSNSGYFGPEGSYLVPADGSAPPSYLSGPFLLAFHANRAGTRLLHRKHEYNPYVSTPTEIFLRDTSPGGTSFQVAPVAGPHWPDAAVQAEAFSGDDARILFVRDQEVQGQFELYSVLPTAGATPVKLSGTLPAAGDVAFGITPTSDGTRVVYAADRDMDGALQLFVSPVDGSSAPLELSPPLAAGESVGVDASFAPLVWVTADSSRALFVLAGPRAQLLSVPLDASSPAAAVGPLPALSAGLPPELGAVRLTRDGRTAVFRAAIAEPGRFELFAAPVAGGAGVRLAATPGAAQDVEPGFVVLRSSREVLFRADLASDERQELWIVPVDASRPPRRVSALGPHDADVEPDFVLASDQDHVYYRADAENDGEIEFFRHPLRTPAVERR